jgi:hypothetical protein
MYFSFGKKLYCSFVDFKSAFDTVWRDIIFQEKGFQVVQKQ